MPDPVGSRDAWAQVAETSQVYEAQLMALCLREAGIPSEVVDQSFRQEPLPGVRSFAVVRVMVPADRASEAREALAAGRPLPENAAEGPPSEEPSGREGPGEGEA